MAGAVPGIWNASLEWLADQLEPRRPDLGLLEVRYRIRSWRDLPRCIEDAAAALDVAADAGARSVTLVGFSMGGSVAVSVAAHPLVEQVIGLAPWLPDRLELTSLRGRRLDVLHGSLDRWFPGIPGVPASLSRRAVERARALGIDTSYRLVHGGVHGIAARTRFGLVRFPRASGWLEGVDAVRSLLDKPTSRSVIVGRMARTAISSDKAEETQRRIVAAAAELFAEHGYHATSLNDVIAAAGSTKGGFYFHFRSKAELALAVLESTRERFRHEVFAATELHERAADQLVSMVRAIAEVARTSVSGGVGRLCAELREERDVPEEAINPYGNWVRIVEGLLVRARSEGSLDPSIDIASAARFAVGAYIGVEQLAGGKELFADRIDDHLRFTLRAIGLHSPTARARLSSAVFLTMQKTDRSVCIRASRRVTRELCSFPPQPGPAGRRRTRGVSSRSGAWRSSRRSRSSRRCSAPRLRVVRTSSARPSRNEPITRSPTRSGSATPSPRRS